MQKENQPSFSPCSFHYILLNHYRISLLALQTWNFTSHGPRLPTVTLKQALYCRIQAGSLHQCFESVSWKVTSYVRDDPATKLACVVMNKEQWLILLMNNSLLVLLDMDLLLSVLLIPYRPYFRGIKILRMQQPFVKIKCANIHFIHVLTCTQHVVNKVIIISSWKTSIIASEYHIIQVF